MADDTVAPDLDTLVRAVIGEAGGEPPQGRQAVASVILNRARQNKLAVSDVVSQPNQFESWGNPQTRAKLLAIKPTDPQYQDVLSTIRPVYNGDVSLPFQNFYAPSLQASDGRSKPSFDDGSGVKIGNHLFFGSAGATRSMTPEEALALATGEHPAQTSAPPAQPITPEQALQMAQSGTFGGVAEDMVDPFGLHVYSKNQSAAFHALAAAGQFDPNAPVGSQKNPHAIATADQAAFDPTKPHSDWVVDANGRVFQPTDAAKPTTAENFGAGLAQGPLNLLQSIGNVVAPKDSAAGNALLGNRLMFESRYGNSPAAMVGQVAGETIPAVLATGGAARAGAYLLMKSPQIAEIAANPILSIMGNAAKGAGEGVAITGLTNAGAVPDATGQRIGDQLRTNMLLGGALAGGGNALMKGVDALGGASSVSPEIRSLADTAVNKYGIDLRGSQIAQTPFMGYLDSQLSKMPVSSVAKGNATQGRQFTSALAKTIGADSDKLTPEVMAQAKSDIGDVFNRVAANTSLTGIDDLQTKLGDIAHEASQVLGDNELKPLLKQIEGIGSVAKDGGTGSRIIPGEAYQALTRKGAPLDAAMSSSNPNIRFYAGQIRNALDDTLEKSATAEDLADLQKARLQYKNLMTLAPLVAKAGPDGQISPALLQGRVNANFKNRAFQGAGDLGELSDIGQNFLKQPADSGTASRSMVNRLLESGFGLGGLAETGLMFAHQPDAAVTTGLATLGLGGLRMGTFAGRKALEAALQSKFYQKALTGSLDAAGLAPTNALSLGSVARESVVPGIIGLKDRNDSSNRLFAPAPKP